VENTRVSSKGQMIIPKRVREALGVKKGTGLSVELRKPRRPGLTDDEAVLRAVAADDARIRAYARKRRRK
jgi:AbrB family looped-hinge helix DNA binding protein